jgi:hypothetical protein
VGFFQSMKRHGWGVRRGSEIDREQMLADFLTDPSRTHEDGHYYRLVPELPNDFERGREW